MELEKLGNLLAKTIFDSRCEKCKVRSKLSVNGLTKNWCKICIERYTRKQDATPEKVDKTTIRLVEPLYANAILSDIEPALLKKILSRKPEQDLFLYGLPGTGKTYILAALIRHYVGQGFMVERIGFDDFCVSVRSTISPASEKTELDMIKPLTEIDMLFIDDLGLRSKRESDFAYGTLYAILNKRQERLLPTFFSSNKDLTRIGEAFDLRITSRLQAALLVEITGVDRRK